MVLDNITAFQFFGSVALGLLGFKIVTKLLPWAYINIFGPMLLGPKLDIRRMGGWAG